MVLYDLTGRRQHHDVTDAVPLLAEKTASKCLTASVFAYIRFFVQDSIGTKVIISSERNVSDSIIRNRMQIQICHWTFFCIPFVYYLLL